MPPLRIALVSYRKVPVVKYGGTERIVQWLARDLIKRGHAVTVIAPRGSMIPGARMVVAATDKQVAEAIPDDIDIVHFHNHRPDGVTAPHITTIHSNIPESSAVPDDYCCFISRSHAERHGRKTFVYNGVSTEEARYRAEKSNRYLFLSRTNRAVKNITRAVELARRYDLELDIGGGHRWGLLARSVVRHEGTFFRTFDRRFRFHGMVHGETKARLFAEARALLFPIRWDEPFGLVVIESLLAGTPVITCPRGAMPELVPPDVGFLCETDEEFRAAFEQVGSIDPKRCRQYGERFSVETMTSGYLELYRRVRDGETLA